MDEKSVSALRNALQIGSVDEIAGALRTSIGAFLREVFGDSAPIREAHLLLMWITPACSIAESEEIGDDDAASILRCAREDAFGMAR